MLRWTRAVSSESSLAQSPTKNWEEVERVWKAVSHNGRILEIQNSCTKQISQICCSTHTPPLALLTQDTALATISGTSLKYGKLSVYKWDKYSSELILFPYRGNFYTAALQDKSCFSYEPSGCTWNNHTAHPAHFRQGEIQTTATNILGKCNSQEHDTKISSEAKATPLHTTVTAQQQAVGLKDKEGLPKSPSALGAALHPTARHFLQSGGLSAEQRVNAPAVTAVSWHSSSGFDL